VRPVGVRNAGMTLPLMGSINDTTKHPANIEERASYDSMQQSLLSRILAQEREKPRRRDSRTAGPHCGRGNTCTPWYTTILTKPRRSTSVEGFALSCLLRNVLGSVGGPLITRASSGPMGRSPDPVTPLVHQRPSGSEVTPTYSYSYAGLAYWACLLQHEGGAGGMAAASRHALMFSRLNLKKPESPN